MDKLINGLREQTTVTCTQNGAVGYSTTGSNIIDFFGNMTSFRYYENNPVGYFEKAFSEMPLETLKLVFYLRDVRGGLGERKAFRRLIRHIAKVHPEAINKNIELIPEFGRWDDLWVLLDTPCCDEVIKFVDKQLASDKKSDYPTLLGKWLPSYTTYETNVDTAKAGHKRKARIDAARILVAKLGISVHEYNTLYRKLRKQINIVERKISRQEWSEIEFEKLPSKALNRYRHVFLKHCPEAYSAYLEKLKKGEAKVNAKTLYPYDIVRKCYSEDDFMYSRPTSITEEESALLNAQWKALPDYLNGAKKDILMVSDTSGSMTVNNSLPLHTSLGLAVYCAQRNEGRFKNMFMTFSYKPQLVEIKHDKLEDILIHDVKYIVENTNMKAVFDLILKIAVDENLKQEELPERVVVVSDMEFDMADCSNFGNKKALFKAIEEEYAAAGYQMPKMIFWNVAAERVVSPIKAHTPNSILVSGHSPALFEAVLSDNLDPLQIVLDLINKERYDRITL